MSGAVIIIGYRALPHQIETAKRAISALIATVQSAEPACGGITMLQDSAEPVRFTLIEHWPSKEIFLGPHMQQPHIRPSYRLPAHSSPGHRTSRSGIP